MKKSQIFGICTIVLAVLGLIFALFLPGMTVKAFGGTASESGAEIMFGNDGWDFSFMLFIGFLCALAGLVLAILPMAGVKVKLFPIIGLVCFVVAALFVFLTKQFAMINGKMFNDWPSAYHLGVGAILGGIFYIIAAVGSALPLVIKD
jgi:hypothetical protein